MSGILDQTIIQYEGQWEAYGSNGWCGGLCALTANDIMAGVTAALAKYGLVTKDASNDAGFFQQHGFPFVGVSQTPFKVKLTLQVNNGLGYGSIDDVSKIISDSVYNVTGRSPISNSIPSIQAPGQIATKTGQPTVTGNPGGTSLLDSIKLLFSDSKILVVGIGLGLVVAVLMIASPKRIV